MILFLKNRIHRRRLYKILYNNPFNYSKIIQNQCNNIRLIGPYTRIKRIGDKYAINIRIKIKKYKLKT